MQSHTPFTEICGFRSRGRLVAPDRFFPCLFGDGETREVPFSCSTGVIAVADPEGLHWFQLKPPFKIGAENFPVM